MATLATQSVSRAGVSPAYDSAAAGGDLFAPGANTFLHVKNGGGATVTVTVATPGSALPDVPIADLAVDVAAGADEFIGPFPAEFFADPAQSGLAAVTYSATASVTLAVLELSKP